MFYRLLSLLSPPRRQRPPRAIPPQRPSFRPYLEDLERRLVPANAVDVFLGGTSDWNTGANWSLGAPPDNQDKAVITAPCVIPSSSTENVAEVSITGGNSLTVNGTLDVAPNGNTKGFTGDISSVSGSTLTDNGTINVSGNTGLLAGTTNIAGAFNLQSGGTSSSDETTTGPTSLLTNGSINSYGLSVFNIANAAGPSAFTVSGGSFDVSATGEINVSGALTLNTNLTMSGQLDITPATYLAGPGVTTPGATISGSGSFGAAGFATWSGGTIANSGGFTIEGSANFQTSGSAAKTLETTLYNENVGTTFGGSGTITVGGPAGTGVLANDQPGSILTLDTSVLVSSKSSFLNDGYLDVGGGTVSVNGLTSDATTSQIDLSSGTTLDLGSSTLGGTLDNDHATVVVPSGTTDTIDAALTQNLTDTGLFLVNGTLSITTKGSATFNGPLQVSGSKSTLTAAGPLTVYDLTIGPTGTLTATAALTNAGTMTIANPGHATTAASFTNDGNLVVDSGSVLTVDDGLSNTASVQVAGSMSVAGPLQNTDTIEVQAGGTLTASGEINNSSSSKSSIVVDAASGYVPAGTLYVMPGGTMVNAGTLTVAGSAGLNDTFTNSGTTEVKSGGSLTDYSNVDNSGALLLESGGTFKETAGTLDNTGGVTLVPGDSATVSNLTQNGNLVEEIASASDYGTLGVSGQLTLTTAPDTLTLTLLDDYHPASGTAFPFLTFGTLQGQFANVEPNPTSWSVTYNTNNITVTAQ